MEYKELIKRKSQIDHNSGFEPLWIPDFLFDFQKYFLERAVLRGRSAMFADCGLGKTPMHLSWAENVIRKTNGNVLVLTPLAVGAQTEAEARKFGIDAKQSRDGKVNRGITITNYERLHYFRESDFVGIVGDESSAIKAFDGKRRKQVTRFMSKIPYRLLCTATAAPNDYIELGTASEALGILSQSEMISQFFKSADNQRHSLFREGDYWSKPKWQFRAHSEIPFWRWVSSWSTAARRPSDVGFENGKFDLPELKINQHVVKNVKLLQGELFPVVATTLNQQREERKMTIKERCEKVAELVDGDKSAVAWCQYNPEGELLEKIIPGAVEVAGRHSDEEKEERLIAFSNGEIRVLITKPKIGAWGLNWQHCGHQTFFPSHSYEQYYQGVRRSWRFGRNEPVTIDIVTTQGEAGVTANLERKQKRADEMFENLVGEVNNATALMHETEKHTKEMELPSWL